MIAREGFYLIAIGVIATIALILLASKYDSKTLFTFSLVVAVLTLFTTFFFRDPHRSGSNESGILVAPADGKIVAIDTLDNHPCVGGSAVKVSIFLSIFDVHVNRVPATGTVDFVRYNPGRFLAAFKDKASELNEQTEIGMTTASGHKIVFKQIAGLIARRIVCHLNEGDSVTAGDRFGMIRFGSRADLIVPAETKLKVSRGDHVAGGETVIGRLPEKSETLDQADNARGNGAEI